MDGSSRSAGVPDDRQDAVAVLAANSRFYDAFQRGDIVAMEDLWATDVPVACIHPGWDALTERARILRSWQMIMDNPNKPSVQCRNETPYIMGALAFVVCQEVLPEGVLATTNIFKRDGDAWKLVHHQSSPLAMMPGEEPNDETSQSELLEILDKTPTGTMH